MGRSSHFTSGVVVTGPGPCDVVGMAQEAQRQTARNATEWARIVRLAMWLRSALELAAGLLQSKNHSCTEKRCDRRGYKTTHSYEEPNVISSPAACEHEEHDETENGSWQGDQRSGGYPAPRK